MLHQELNRASNFDVQKGNGRSSYADYVQNVIVFVVLSKRAWHKHQTQGHNSLVIGLFEGVIIYFAPVMCSTRPTMSRSHLQNLVRAC